MQDHQLVGVYFSSGDLLHQECFKFDSCVVLVILVTSQPLVLEVFAFDGHLLLNTLLNLILQYERASHFLDVIYWWCIWLRLRLIFFHYIINRPILPFRWTSCRFVVSILIWFLLINCLQKMLILMIIMVDGGHKYGIVGVADLFSNVRFLGVLWFLIDIIVSWPWLMVFFVGTSINKRCRLLLRIVTVYTKWIMIHILLLYQI